MPRLDSTINELERLTYTKNIVTQSEVNGASVISKRVTIATGVNYFAFDVPAGRVLYLWERDLTLGEGEYEIDVQRCDDYSTAGATSMLVAPLNSLNPTSITTDFYFGVSSPTGVVTVEEGYLNAGSGLGASITASALSQERVFKVFEGKGLLRINRLTAGSVKGNLLLIAWEENRSR